MPTLERYTASHVDLLRALARYKYLVHSQFQRLDLTVKNPTHLIKVTGELRKAGLTDRIQPPIIPGKGRAEALHFLTPKGAKFLAEMEGVSLQEIGFHPVFSAISVDYWHRRTLIDFQIALDEGLEPTPLTVGTFNRYFDKTGANRTSNPETAHLRSMSRVELGKDFFIIPDAIFTVQDAADPSKRVLFCLEIAMGDKTKQNLEQIRKHIYAMKTGAIPELYGTKTGYRCLHLFERAELMEAVVRRFTEIPDASAFREYFLFSDVESFRANPMRSWKAPGSLETVNFITGRV